MKTLFSPLQFPSGAQAENRIWLAPLTNLQSHADGSLSTDELRWLQRRAEGGFGIVETCAAYVAKDGQGWAGELGVAEDRHLPGLQPAGDYSAAASRALASCSCFTVGYVPTLR
jgi:2,4-dienoyl-CoA reductase-like NADH-dependent reductase (Old Yellow Enzyme family)